MVELVKAQKERSQFTRHPSQELAPHPLKMRSTVKNRRFILPIAFHENEYPSISDPSLLTPLQKA